MTIPEPNEFAKNGGYQPFPPRWENWLSAIRAGLLSAQPKPGRHVTTEEYRGKGTVINVADISARRRSRPVGACCVGEVCSIKTEADCATAGGIYQGDGTDCDPNPCVTPPPPNAECPYNISISGSFSGSLVPSETCDSRTTIPFSGSASSPNCLGINGAPANNCYCNTPEVEFTVTCENAVCQRTWLVRFSCGLNWNGTYWNLNIDGGPDAICGATCLVGGAPIHEENLGSDPVGTHTMTFDDADCPTVHYNVSVTITAA